MRHHLLPAVLLTLGVGIASPALAEDADCGILCRINSYLSSDHMAAAPSEAAPAAAPKGHRTHVAHKGAAKPTAGAASKIATAVKPEAAKPPVKSADTTKSKLAAAKSPPVAAARTTPVPAKTADAASPHSVAHPAVVAKQPAPRPAAEVVAQTSSAPVRPAVRHRVASTALAARPAQPSNAQTASAIIPGAAPAMPVGFQPFAVSFH